MSKKNLKNKISCVHFDIVLPFSSPIVPHKEELTNINSVKDLMANYRRIKKKYPKQKVVIFIEEECPCCSNLIENKISLKKLKNRVKSQINVK